MALSGWHPVDLAGEVLRALVERNGLDPELIDDVIIGCVMQVGAQSVNVGRNAALAAGLPESVPATTVDRQCGSSQQAIHFAAQGVMAGAYDVVIAAGVEVMSLVPMGASAMVPAVGLPFGPAMMRRYAPDGGLVPQGISAELVAERWGLTRPELDELGRAQPEPGRPSHQGGPLQARDPARCPAAAATGRRGRSSNRAAWSTGTKASARTRRSRSWPA